MKQITIKGSIIVENSMIMEANLFDNLCDNLVKNGFFGKLLQPIFGGNDKKDAKKLSEYEQARQDMIKKFKDQREEEIKNEIEHKDKMKALQYRQTKMAELVQRKSEEAKKQMERKAAEQVADAEIKKLENTIKKIDVLSKMSGPATKAELEYLQTVAQEIGDRMPAQAQLANNVVGITAVAYDGVFDGDEKLTPEKLEEKIKENMTKKFGNDWENNPDINTPEFQSAIKSWKKTVDNNTDNSIDDMKKEIESNIKLLANNGIPIKSEEELNEQQSKLTELAKEVSDIELKRSDCQKKVEELETRMKDMDKAKEERAQKKSELEAAQKKIEALQGVNNDNIQDHRDKVIDAIGDVKISDYYTTEGEGDNASTELDEKKAKAFCDETGISIDEFKKLCDSSEKTSSLADVMKKEGNKEITDKICQKAVEHLQGQKQIVNDALTNITNEETTANTKYTELEEQLKTAKQDLTNAEGETPNMELAQTALGDDYTIPVTTEVVKKVQTSVKKDIERNNKFKEQLEKAKEAAIKSGEKMKDDTDMEKYINDHPDLKKELDKITPKSPALATDTESGQEYIEIPNPDKPGEKIKMYKPQSGDDPENIKRWDNLVAQKDAAIVPDENAVKKAKEDLDATPEDSADRDEKLSTYYKAKKQYDVDKRARDAARAKLSQDDIDKLDDADELKKWAEETDGEGKTKGADNIENVDDEGADDKSEVDDEQAKKDAENTQNELNDLETELKEKLSGEQIKKLKDGEDFDTKDLDDETKDAINNYKKAQKKLKEATDKNTGEAKQNPARIWKRKRNKSTGKMTKRYYYVGKDAERQRNNESIPAKEYQQKMNDFKKRKEAKSKNESNNDTRKIIFEKSKWNMTPLFGMKK